MRQPDSTVSFALSHENRIVWCVAATFVCLLLAQSLIMPPYEGFDETAHYSYISYLSDRGNVPDLRFTPLDASIRSDCAGLPGRYSGRPPFDVADRMTYHRFFNAIPDSVRVAASDKFWNLPRSVQYEPDEDPNWQGQHPPLYYLLMVTPYRLLADATPAARVFGLRLVSIVLVCCSLLFWVLMLRLFSIGRARTLVLLAGAVVLFVPSFYYGLARMGNGSLVTFLFAGTFYFLLAVGRRKTRWFDLLGLSIFIGLGLITKQFFLPVWAGAVICLLWYGWKSRQRPGVIGVRVATLIVVPLVIAGWWYLIYFGRYGVLFGGAESILSQSVTVHWIDQVSTGEFFSQLLRSIAAFGATFFWSGSWSYVHRPFWQYAAFVPFGLLWLVRFIDNFRRMTSEEARNVVVAAIVVLALTKIALGIHLIERLCLTGTGTGGYNLFAAWPMLGVLLAPVLLSGADRFARALTLAAFGVLLWFDLSGFWFEAQVYSGLVAKAGSVKAGVGALPLTPSNFATSVERLRLISFPVWGWAFFVIATGLKMYLLRLIIFRPNSESPAV